jgi:hypothetical protein
MSEANEGRQLRDRVLEEGVRRFERPHELAEQLEADHSEQLRPRDNGADQHVRGNGAGTGRGGGLGGGGLGGFGGFGGGGFGGAGGATFRVSRAGAGGGGFGG